MLRMLQIAQRRLQVQSVPRARLRGNAFVQHFLITPALASIFVTSNFSTFCNNIGPFLPPVKRARCPELAKADLEVVRRRGTNLQFRC
jgi:hypothetical protein